MTLTLSFKPGAAKALHILQNTYCAQIRCREADRWRIIWRSKRGSRERNWSCCGPQIRTLCFWGSSSSIPGAAGFTTASASTGTRECVTLRICVLYVVYTCIRILLHVSVAVVIPATAGQWLNILNAGYSIVGSVPGRIQPCACARVSHVRSCGSEWNPFANEL
jgi:hypothetical protein